MEPVPLGGYSSRGQWSRLRLGSTLPGDSGAGVDEQDDLSRTGLQGFLHCL